MGQAITVFEGGRVALPVGPVGDRAARRLLSVNVGRRAAFVFRRGSLFATDLVGAVDVGCVRVEVLPKPYGVDTETTARQLMFDMLRWAGPEIRPSWLRVGGSMCNGDLLQLVERRAASELLRQLEVGAPRRYQEVREKSAVLRGRVEFGRYVRQLPTEAHHLPISHCPLTWDNPLGRLLKSLANYLRGMTTSYSVRRDLDRCLDALIGVKSEPLTVKAVARVRLERLESPWSELVDLAGVLARGRSPDPSGLGDTRQLTLMFPLNRLFESIVRRVLVAHLRKPLSCLRSPGEHVLLSLVSDRGGGPALTVRPDLLFHLDGHAVGAGDAKWKRLKNTPSRYSVLPADLYQILTYMRLVNTTAGLLFFPRADWMPEGWSAEFVVEPCQQERIVCLAVDLARVVGSSGLMRQQGAHELASRVQAVLQRVAVGPAGPIATEIVATDG